MSEPLSELSVSLWRGAQSGRYETYMVPRRESQTVLDVVTFVQRHIDPTLSYRFACRVGVCGSCAMTVNGRPRWTCRTHVAKVAGGGRLEIGPLENLPVIKDLTTDMAPFFEKWQRRERRLRALARPGTTPSSNQAGQPGADRRRRGHRMHQLRRLLCRLRYGALESRLSRPGGADAGVDAGERRTRRRQYRAAASRRGGRRLPRLPLAPILPGTLPAGAQPDRRDRRAEAAHRGGLSQGRDQAMNVRLYLWQRGTRGAHGAAGSHPYRRHLLRDAAGLHAPPIFCRARTAAWFGRRSTGFLSPRPPFMPRSASAIF